MTKRKPKDKTEKTTLKKRTQKDKIGNAIHEITKIDELARQDKLINNIHPLIKLIITIGYILLVISTPKYNECKQACYNGSLSGGNVYSWRYKF